MLLYLIDMLILGAVSIRATRVRRNGELRYELTPSLVLVLSYFLYASALPVSRVIVGSPPAPGDAEYLLPHLLAGVGIMLGLLLYRDREVPPLLPDDEL